MGKLISMEGYKLKKDCISQVNTYYKLLIEHQNQYSTVKRKRLCLFRGSRLKSLSYKIQRDKDLIADYTRLYCNID